VEETSVTISNEDGPALNMYGEYEVSDRSWGLISRPGYYQTLAEYLAREIVSTLKDLYRGMPLAPTHLAEQVKP
jgi:hypothetical protein